MGRPYAKLFRDIWTDGDFLSLSPETRYVYMFLFSQPDLNAAGVLPLLPGRWSRMAAITTDAMRGALRILDKHEYALIDEGTEELLIRTYVRNDELWRIPNTLYSVVRDAARTVSPFLRGTLADELSRLPVDELDGKKAAQMKLQVTTVTATLRATAGPRVGPTEGCG